MKGGRTMFEGEDITESQALEREYDLHVSCSSFEARCRAIPSLIEAKLVTDDLIVGLSGCEEFDERRISDAWYRERGLEVVPVCPGSPQQALSEAYRRIQRMRGPTNDGFVRVLIDYSSMPKSIYVGILALARFLGNIELVFGYDVGARPQGPWASTRVDKIRCVPGFEGAPTSSGPGLALFSLGFDGNRASGLEELLQPYASLALIAAPGVEARDADRAVEANEQLLREAPLVRAPIRSVWTTVGLVRDAVRLRRPTQSVVFVPLGPKPHALALAVVAAENRRISYLHVMTRVPTGRNIRSGGERVWTTVHVPKHPVK